ncbi:thyrotropin-releasing hormone receptor-like [Anabrus simplex]|uniref:thyrotropin-releasing hormone receptor-like n=1 Tax=Anabrus simplex TaxID=316456 RepID=UPI0035A395F4
MLVVVVAIHTILWLPYRGMFLYNNFATVFNMDKFSDLWFIMFAKTCIFINSAVKLFLYSTMYEEFQNALKNIFTCQRTTTTDTNSAMAPSTRKLSQKPTLEDPERMCSPYHDNSYHMCDQNPQLNACGSAEVDLIRDT